jgi:hypothetical protein
VLVVEVESYGFGRRSVVGTLVIEHIMTARGWKVVAVFARSGLMVDSISGEVVAGTVTSH